MISYLCLLVQFSPAAGRAGRCRQMSQCMVSTRRVLAREPEVLAPSPRVRCAFSPAAGSQGGQRFVRPLPGCCAPFLSAASSPGSQRSVQPLHGRGAPFSLRGERLGQPEAWRTLPWRGAPFPSMAPARARTTFLHSSTDGHSGCPKCLVSFDEIL